MHFTFASGVDSAFPEVCCSAASSSSPSPPPPAWLAVGAGVAARFKKRSIFFSSHDTVTAVSQCRACDTGNIYPPFCKCFCFSAVVSFCSGWLCGARCSMLLLLRVCLCSSLAQHLCSVPLLSHADHSCARYAHFSAKILSSRLRPQIHILSAKIHILSALGRRAVLKFDPWYSSRLYTAVSPKTVCDPKEK